MENRKEYRISILVCALLIIPLYIILHESGHSLIAILRSGKITDFSILGTHMNYEGGTFNALTLSLFNAFGMLLPVILTLIHENRSSHKIKKAN